MAKIIENPKTYSGTELEEIFLRPSFSGPNAMDLGVRLLFNVAIPTTLNFWSRNGDVIKKYQRGFQGGDLAKKFQKTITLEKLKVEMAYNPEDYFNMIYEKITNSNNVNLQDLSGTQLEAAETALFRESIAESLRASMWLGNKNRGTSASYNAFDGFLQKMCADIGSGSNDIKAIPYVSMTDADGAETIFKNLYRNAPLVLQEAKDTGNLVYLATTDICNNYEDSIDAPQLEIAYLAKQNGRAGLRYKGIPIVDVKLSGYISAFEDMPQSFVILTDRRNLAMAFNTNDYPGMSIDMWYDRRQIENCQRAVFMAGCDYLLPELIVGAFDYKEVVTVTGLTATGGAVTLSGSGAISSVSAQGINSSGANDGDAVSLTRSATTGLWGGTVAGTALAKVKFTVTYKNGDTKTITK